MSVEAYDGGLILSASVNVLKPCVPFHLVDGCVDTYSLKLFNDYLSGVYVLLHVGRNGDLKIESILISCFLKEFLCLCSIRSIIIGEFVHEVLL